MFLDQPYHECDDPEWEFVDNVCFEDGRAEFKYDCVARHVHSGYNYSQNQVMGEMGTPCGATEYVYLDARDDVSEEALEAIERVGSDLNERVTVVRADPPTPEEPNGLFVVEIYDYRVVYQ